MTVSQRPRGGDEGPRRARGAGRVAGGGETTRGSDFEATRAAIARDRRASSPRSVSRRRSAAAIHRARGKTRGRTRRHRDRDRDRANARRERGARRKTKKRARETSQIAHLVRVACDALREKSAPSRRPTVKKERSERRTAQIRRRRLAIDFIDEMASFPFKEAGSSVPFA